MNQQSSIKYYRPPISGNIYKVNHATNKVYMLRRKQKDFILLYGRTWTTYKYDSWYEEISEEEVVLEMLE